MKISELVSQSYAIEEIASYDRFQTAIENIEAEQQLAYAFETLDRAYKVSTALENISEIIAENPPETNESKEVITSVITNELNRAGIEIKDTAFSGGNPQQRYELATEGIGDFLSRIWDAIIEFIKKIKDFIVGLFSSNKSASNQSAGNVETAEVVEKITDNFEEDEKALTGGSTTVAEIRSARKTKIGGKKPPMAKIPEKVISSKTRHPLSDSLVKGLTRDLSVLAKNKVIVADHYPCYESRKAAYLRPMTGKFPDSKGINSKHTFALLKNGIKNYTGSFIPYYDGLINVINTNIDVIEHDDLDKFNFDMILSYPDCRDTVLGKAGIVDDNFKEGPDHVDLHFGVESVVGLGLTIKNVFRKQKFKELKNWFFHRTSNYTTDCAVTKYGHQDTDFVTVLSPTELREGKTIVKELDKIHSELLKRMVVCEKLCDRLTKLASSQKSEGNSEAKLKAFKLCLATTEKVALRLLVHGSQSVLQTSSAVVELMEVSSAVHDPANLAAS